MPASSSRRLLPNPDSGTGRGCAGPQRLCKSLGRNPPRIVVAGPGALGCLFAAFFAENGDATTLLGRRPDQAAALQRSGLRIRDEQGERTVAVAATADPACVAEADFVLICVKSYDTDTLLAGIGPHLAGRTRVATLQNGLDASRAVERLADGRNAACAVTAHGALRLAPGLVVHAGAGPTRVAPCRAAFPAPARDWVAQLRRARLSAAFVADRDRMIWSKLALNVGVNPVTALAGICNGELLLRPELFAQARQAACEAVAVARAAGVALDENRTIAALRRICRGTARNRSSMLQDLSNGRPTEIEALNGAVVREGRRRGVPVPVNEALAQAIRKVAQASSLWGK